MNKNSNINKSAQELYPERRKKLKYMQPSVNFDNLRKATINEINDNVVSTVGMYPMTRNNQDLNIALETELKYSLNENKKLTDVALDTGKYSPINFNKLTDGGHALLSDKTDYTKLTVLQDFDKSVKDAGQVFTFKSATRKMNLDYSEHLMPPLKTYGRGVGDVKRLNDTYLGDEARVNNFDVRGYEYVREQELPIDYYVVNREVWPMAKAGIDTRYLNYKNARSRNLV
jgi:hypothetical protein